MAGRGRAAQLGGYCLQYIYMALHNCRDGGGFKFSMEQVLELHF